MELIVERNKHGNALDHKHRFELLYEQAFPKVAKFVSKMNGSFDDAKDIFQEALVIYFEKLAGADLRLHTSEEAYILGIAKHLWVRKFKLDSRRVVFESFEQQIAIEVDTPPEPDTNKLLRILESSGKKCMELLRAVYFDQLPIKNITERLRYRNEHSASVQKYKCLEKVRDVVKSKSMTYEQFIN